MLGAELGGAAQLRASAAAARAPRAEARDRGWGLGDTSPGCFETGTAKGERGGGDGGRGNTRMQESGGGETKSVVEGMGPAVAFV